MFSSGHGRGTDPRKDSQRNAEVTGEFVCNMATYDLREEMNATSESVPIEVDELALAGLTSLPSKLVKPPRVAESPVHLRSEEHTSELQSLMRISYAVFCLKKTKTQEPHLLDT